MNMNIFIDMYFWHSVTKLFPSWKWTCVLHVCDWIGNM